MTYYIITCDDASVCLDIVHKCVIRIGFNKYLFTVVVLQYLMAFISPQHPKQSNTLVT